MWIAGQYSTLFATDVAGIRIDSDTLERQCKMNCISSIRSLVMDQERMIIMIISWSLLEITFNALMLLVMWAWGQFTKT